MSRGLATIDPLVLPGVMIRPATCEVEANDRVEQLEPRVMQVLVELVEARGRVVSRDMLIERCWGGLIVGDDAVNRVTARLRRLGNDSGAFRLDTIRKVGYRLVPAVPTVSTGPLAQIARGHAPSPRRRAARARGVANAVVLVLVAAVMFRFGNQTADPGVAAPAVTTAPVTTRLAQQRLPGRWGPPDCAATYEIAIREGRVLLTAPGRRSEWRIITADDDRIVSEGVLPTGDRGTVFELRPDGDRLTIDNRATDTREVLSLCPLRPA